SADEIDLCLRWPGAGSQPVVAAPSAHPGVPALLLQGGEDLRTPPEVSARVATELPDGHRVLVPGVGHGVITADPSGCAASVLGRLLGRSAVCRKCARGAH